MSTDSRQVGSGTLFFALKGPSFNGNDFILDALSSGASFAVADESRESFKGNERIFIVDDGLTALQALAKTHRSRLKIPVIGLTGSNGKTTSKELLKAALSTFYSTYATKGNLNNHIGVPLSILEIDSSHEIAIIEMGANHIGEIAALCAISKPDYGYITNIGLAHLEGFGSEHGVLTGKKELFDYLQHNDGKLFVNVDDPKVVTASGGCKSVTYGTEPEAHFQGSFTLSQGKLNVAWWRNVDPFERHIKTQLTGSYNFSNVLSAVAIARYFGVPDDKIKRGIEAYQPKNNRSQVEQTDRNNTVIVDCYNANPSSMSAAIQNLALHEQSPKLAILGDMLELGDSSEQNHKQVLQQLTERGLDAILVGDAFHKIATASSALVFHTPDEVKKHLSEHPINDTLILLKGSRKLKLEQMLELL